MKVLPVALGYTAEVTSHAIDAIQHRVSISKQLVQAGLALPFR